MIEQKKVSEPKKVVCAECKQSVNKRQTVLIADGMRVCKTHQGAELKSEQYHTSLLRKKHGQGKTEKENVKTELKDNFLNKKVCLVCNREGISAGDFFMELAVSMEKLSLSGNATNPFDPDFATKIKSVMGEKQRPIFYLDLNKLMEKHGKEIVSKILILSHTKFKIPIYMNFILMSGFFPICIECLEKNKMFHLVQENFPKPNLETLTLFGVHSGPILRDVIEKRKTKEEAKEELRAIRDLTISKNH